VRSRIIIGLDTHAEVHFIEPDVGLKALFAGNL
jgi:hypothetical protein